MRRRALPKEHSLCIFCSHIISGIRPPLSQRLFHASRVLSKPPAAAFAAQKGVSPQAKNGSPPSVAEDEDDDFTEEELRIRELMRKKHLEDRRNTLVDVHGGPGPESTRAGRFVSASQLPDRQRTDYDAKNARIEGARINQEKLKQRKMEFETKGFSVRRGTSVDYINPRSGIERNPDESSRRTSDHLGNWENLKKRQQESSLPRETKQKGLEVNEMSDFAKARAEREIQASSRTYVPISLRPPPRSASGSFSLSSGRREYKGFLPDETDTGAPRGQSELKPSFSRGPSGARTVPIGPGEWRNEAPPRDDRLRRVVRSVDSRNPYDSTTGSGNEGVAGNTNYKAGRRNSPDIMSSQESPSSQRAASEIPKSTIEGYEIPDTEPVKSGLEGYEIPDRLEEFNESTKSRFSAARPSPRFEPIPKGKDRDKAKRREQFVSSYNEVEDEEAAARAEAKRQRKAEKAAKKAAALTPIFLPEWISVSNLATALKVRLDDFINKLTELGFEETTHDFVIGAEDAGLIAQEYGFEPIIDRGDEDDLKARPPAEDISALPPRPPVVTIMGHVDHGKTTLLDWLRKSSVVASEHGGITQHIGAFSVPMPSGKIITFLDTPGHEAFLSMRQRGANVTDIVILVVAADDSVKPQTIEAINHAKAAKVPVIVAINKVDKPDSNPERAKQDLARHGIEVEDVGGDTQAVCVSGLTGQGMGDLEEAVVTLSEILDMRAETDGPAEGWVIEASLKSMGKVATILVKRGTMRPGDFIVAGKTWARIRCMRNEAGVEIEEAGPGTPVEIDGWREQPLAGDEVLQAPDESIAKQAVDYRLEKEERERMAEDMEAINEVRKAEQESRAREKREAAIAAGELPAEELEEQEEESTTTPGVKFVNYILKADVSGSAEAVVDSLTSLGNSEVRPKILRSGVGQLTEFDVEHAAAAKGHLINFNTEVDPNIAMRALRLGVTILDHNIIYKLVDDVRAKLSEELPPIVSHSVTGEAEIAKVFDITIKGRKTKPIAGCRVRNGVIKRASKVRVMRQGEKIFDGAFATLKNVKKNVLEMHKGNDCGIELQGWSDFREGDLIQCYDEIQQKRYL